MLSRALLSQLRFETQKLAIKGNNNMSLVRWSAPLRHRFLFRGETVDRSGDDAEVGDEEEAGKG